MSLSTHVLDAVTGRPASGMGLTLSVRAGEEWLLIAARTTDADGRAHDLVGELGLGMYRLAFDTGAYFEAAGQSTFYPEVVVSFEVTNAGDHYHVPLLLSPFAYSTYRGS